MNVASPDIRLALYQPDIPQNVGAAIRLCACVGAGLEIIQPCGFVWDARKIRQSAMDYYDRLDPVIHNGWEGFMDMHKGRRRVILLTTRAEMPYSRMRFAPGDVLLTGRESEGVPEAVRGAVDFRVGVPMEPGLRSLNVINAAAMVLGEALRQVRWNTE